MLSPQDFTARESVRRACESLIRNSRTIISKALASVGNPATLLPSNLTRAKASVEEGIDLITQAQVSQQRLKHAAYVPLIIVTLGTHGLALHVSSPELAKLPVGHGRA